MEIIKSKPLKKLTSVLRYLTLQSVNDVIESRRLLYPVDIYTTI